MYVVYTILWLYCAIVCAVCSFSLAESFQTLKLPNFGCTNISLVPCKIFISFQNFGTFRKLSSLKYPFFHLTDFIDSETKIVNLV